MLGHTSIKHTQLYARIVAEKVKSEMRGIEGLYK
jgi:site-specific recombinase XerD